VDNSYLSARFKAKSKKAQALIDHTVNGYILNTEQERAFRIIANHAVTPQSEQLKMYLGGMGGTGKSQVIKALIHMFKSRNESHRFVVLGPTGTAAALLGGSTYHSFLGIKMSDSGSIRNDTATSATMAQIRSRLEGVDYIFLDEVSMLACHDMHKISSQLAKALNVDDPPFGGVNIVFSGDFAQLPPVGGASLYSGQVGTRVDSGLKPHLQEAALGKALWHQVTTVVILRENMRQKSQTEDDAKFRSALVNMRYGACTPENIKFLRSRIAGRRPEQPKVSAKEFRNVAIICGLHTQKDRINQLGCERFAAETGQKLTNFYSIDKWGKEADPSQKKKWGKSKAASKLRHKSNEINSDDQREIWKLRSGATGHFAGKLSLCLGMPVMIRNNDATELCITKGQEGFVVGWQSKIESHGKRVLETLFVRLDNPPQLVQIPGLPDNVVPIVKGRKTVECVFPSDLRESVERQQVWVIQNFAMTAHAAQGKTRPYNVVHLNSCYSHMAYYTALSRSATAEGTIIIQGFDPKVITRPCSGYLRQEFREHELLDDITRLRYEGKLPGHVAGLLRNDLIDQFQQWKGKDYVPSKTDTSLRWSANDPFNLPPTADAKLPGMSGHSLGSPMKVSSTFVPAKGSKPVIRSPPSSPLEGRPSKKQRTAESESEDDSAGPIGLEWDGEDWSCAYDTFFTILYDIWIQDPKTWSRRFRAIQNPYLTKLEKGFRQSFLGKLSLEDLRDSIRPQLHAHDPQGFPWGQIGTSVGTLAETMLWTEEPVTASQLVCTNCDYKIPEEDSRHGYFVSAVEVSVSTSKWLANFGYSTQYSCPECLSDMRRHIFYKNPPNILVLNYPGKDIRTSHKIVFDSDEGYVTLHLRGIIYLGGYHFTSRVICTDGSVWYHDGQKGHICNEEGLLKLMRDRDLRACEGRALTLAVYAQV
jgi:hypothetical protein